ncbi:MAG: hypothetical protein CMJ77_09875 [Planctomycetaceae bacterium]|nr:hypothetical protein [Planctomycetaceae bacterium]
MRSRPPIRQKNSEHLSDPNAIQIARLRRMGMEKAGRRQSQSICRSMAQNFSSIRIAFRNKLGSGKYET